MSLNEESKTDEVKRKLGPYTLGDSLGKGGYSWVKKGVQEKTNKAFALKFMLWDRKNLSKEQARQVHCEINAMMRINNPYVMKLETYDLHCNYPDKSGKTLNTMMLVLEYCPGGELFDILLYTHQLDPVTARTYFVQMLKGVKACHEVGVVHRDIKPQNLLLDERYQLKISDFGLSFLSKEKNETLGLLKSYCGTPGYQAPELLKGEWYTKACDIFSCGVVLFILLTGYPPFRKAGKDDKYYSPMCELNHKLFWRNHPKAKMDADCKELITGMLAYKAKIRLTLDECMNHKWVAGRKIHSPQQLVSAVQGKQRVARNRRRMDKKRMQDTSVKVKKKRVINKSKNNDNNKLYPFANVVKVLSISQVVLPVSEDYSQSLLTFFAPKSVLNEAYVAAVNVFWVAFRGKSHTVISPINPWNVETHVKVFNGVSEQEFSVALYVREINGTSIVAFTYKRLQGDAIAFARIWDTVEQYLMKNSGNIFLDHIDNSAKSPEENKQDE